MQQDAGSGGPGGATRLDGAGASPITEDDLYLFNEGTHSRLYLKLGAHLTHDGAHFAVWAPNAGRVSVIGDFNGWDASANPLAPRGNSGIWEGFVSGVGQGARYKYRVESRVNDYSVDKADPYAFFAEEPPATASVLWQLDYEWGDAEWMNGRSARHSLSSPISVYEVHLGSWILAPEEGNRYLSYRELAPKLADYVRRMNYTHVELMPVMEHPFYGSWGYQTTGYFAPSSRYGTPQDFMSLVDTMHQAGIGVILDWVPSHFPSDEHGLVYFDGTHLYEHQDPRQGFHPDWNSYIFNYSRSEVRGFLLSSAVFWMDKYHADGLRVDAVASMLYLNYSRKDGEWIPNQYGGNENLEAISFLRQLNEVVYGEFPGAITVAEESTAWPMVSRPTYLGGLGFGAKWDMGWMHDTLSYMERDPIYRAHHHGELTFRQVYAFSENFMLPLSHDEVVHGKGSLLGKMPGDSWQKMANLRLLFAYMNVQPGKKLSFMGGEFGQWREWDHDSSLQWDLLEYQSHEGLRRWVEDVNRAYRDEPALHRMDCDPNGFAWIDASNAEQSVLAFLRYSDEGSDPVAVVCNFTPTPRHNYRIGVPYGGLWREMLNSDAPLYGGSGQGNLGGVEAGPVAAHGFRHSLTLTLPPLGAIFLRPDRSQP
ncbi:MAG: 1,4-alpha-glucan branching protein GlgB [Chloroflexota bacterium]